MTDIKLAYKSLLEKYVALQKENAALRKENDALRKENTNLWNENRVLKQIIDKYGLMIGEAKEEVDCLYEIARGRKCQQKDRHSASASPVSDEKREEVRSEILQSITGRFRFRDDQLGVDAHQAKITKERLADLFRRCFGRGSHPSQKQQAVIEALWNLLVGNRQNCQKADSELYYRQTILNILGYFRSQGLLKGLKNKIAQAVFPDATDTLTKNVSRGISSHIFPEGTKSLLDYYIAQLMSGAI